MNPDPDSPDMWRRLGLSRDATYAEIKASYRNLARRYHPDHNADPSAPDRFHRITEAYAFVTDPANGAGGPGRSGPAVSEETVMVLLAEVRVGSVSDHFPARAEGGMLGSPTEPSAGLVCLGELGIAFVAALPRAELRARAEEAVLPLWHQDIVSIEVTGPPANTGGQDQASARIATSQGKSLTIVAPEYQLERLRTAHVRYRAGSLSMPEAPSTSLSTRWGSLRLKLRGLRSRKSGGGLKRAPGSKLPLTNGWWIVGAGVVAVLIVVAAVLLA